LSPTVHGRLSGATLTALSCVAAVGLSEPYARAAGTQLVLEVALYRDCRRFASRSTSSEAVPQVPPSALPED
jgi:hypothetical protein